MPLFIAITFCFKSETNGNKLSFYTSLLTFRLPEVKKQYLQDTPCIRAKKTVYAYLGNFPISRKCFLNIFIANITVLLILDV